MKKTLLLMLTAMVATASWANGRTTQQMLRIAQEKVGMPVKALVPYGSKRGAKGQVQTSTAAYAIYQPQNGNGFVIVGADDRLPEVLGYSTHCGMSADDMPTALREALDNLNKRLPSLTAPYKASNVTYEPIDTLIQTWWDQNSPYNRKCPVYLNENDIDTCATGCITTAMAQVINFWGKKGQFPTMGEGSTSWTSKGEASIGGQTMSLITNMTCDFTTPLDFANMPNLIGPTRFNKNSLETTFVPYTEEQSDAVSTLMQMCGGVAEIDYGEQSGGSSAYLDNLIQHYKGFATGSRLLLHSFYSTDEWMPILYDQLKKGYPIPYTGYTADASDGHAFVVDGIDANGKVHVNWGWAGLSNGYYDVEWLFPAHQGTGGSSSPDAYSTFSMMAVDFAPDELEPNPVSDYRCGSILYDVDQQLFDFVGFSTISHVRQAEIAITVTNEQTQEQDTLLLGDDVASVILPKKVDYQCYVLATDTVGINLCLDDFADGTYRLGVITRDPGQIGWSTVRTPLNQSQYVEVTIQDGKVVETANGDTKAAAKGTIAVGKPEAVLRAGSRIPLNVNVENTGNVDLVDALAQVVVWSQNDTVTFNNGIIIPVGESKSLQFTTTPKEPGEYSAFVSLIYLTPETPYVISDTIHYTVQEPMLSDNNFLLPGPSQEHPFAMLKPLTLQISGTSNVTKDKLYVYLTMSKTISETESKLIFNDSLLVENVKPGTTFTCQETLPLKYLEEGTYFCQIAIGNQEENDVAEYGATSYKGHNGYSIYIVEPGDEYNLDLEVVAYLGESTETLDKANPLQEQIKNQKVYIKNKGNGAHNVTLPDIYSEKYNCMTEQITFVDFDPNVETDESRVMKLVTADAVYVLTNIIVGQYRNDEEGMAILLSANMMKFEDEEIEFAGQMFFAFHGDQITTGVSNVTTAPSTLSGKFINKGRLVIFKNGKQYNAAGQLLK